MIVFFSRRICSSTSGSGIVGWYGSGRLDSATLASDGWRRLGQAGGERSCQACVAFEQSDVCGDDPIAQPALQLFQLRRGATRAANGDFPVGRELVSCNRQLAAQRLAHDEAG